MLSVWLQLEVRLEYITRPTVKMDLDQHVNTLESITVSVDVKCYICSTTVHCTASFYLFYYFLNKLIDLIKSFSLSFLCCIYRPINKWFSSFFSLCLETKNQLPRNKIGAFKSRCRYHGSKVRREVFCRSASKQRE